VTSLEALRSEHDAERIGHMWIAEVRRACRLAVQRYPPRLYAGAESWSDGVEDLIQDVVTNALLRDGQAEYLVAVAATLQDFRNLLALQVRHVLARRRRRTVVDQLLARARGILAGPEFAVSDSPEGRQWTLAASEPLARSPTPAELRAAVAAARTIPRTPAHGNIRAPTVYRTDDLRALLVGVARVLPVRFGLRELDWVLREVLTDFLPGVLEPVERPSRSTAKPEEIVQVTETTSVVLRTLSQRNREVLAAKLAGIADADIAKVLKVSRPTAANAKHSVVQLLQVQLEGLSQPAQEAVIDDLARQLAGCWPPREGRK